MCRGRTNTNAQIVRTEVLALKHQSKDTSDSVTTVFDTVLNPDTEKGEYSPSDHDLTADAVFIFVAGTDTTANTLAIGTWNLLRNPHMLQALKSELRQAIPEMNTTLDWVTLENLPYLVRARSPVSNVH